jgi:hypothetical protein
VDVVVGEEGAELTDRRRRSVHGWPRDHRVGDG